MWCAQASKRCKSCGNKVCAKHASAANGCCVPCMHAVQEAVRAGRCTDQAEEEEIEAIGGPEAATYGEVTPLGFRSLASRISLTSEDAFVDLGSGLGRVVVQAADEFGVRHSIGVELAASRHELAEELAAASPAADRITLLRADCAAAALWAAHLDGVATAVYASNLLFDEALMRRLAERLEACASVRVVVSLKPFEPLRGFVEELPRELVETSWRAPEDLQQAGALEQSGSLVYVYRRAR